MRLKIKGGAKGSSRYTGELHDGICDLCGGYGGEAGSSPSVPGTSGTGDRRERRRDRCRRWGEINAAVKAATDE